MIKPISLSLGFAILVASAANAFAQGAPADAATAEAVRRQADTIELRDKLAKAKTAEDAGEVAAAVKLYEDSLSLALGIGTNNVAEETTSVVDGLTRVRLFLAREAQRHHQLSAADDQVRRVLRFNPGNEAAQEFKKKNDKLIHDSQGTMPDLATLSRVPTLVSNRISNATQIQNAKLLYENGQYDEAEAILQKVKEKEPGNYAAAYYSSLIKEKRHANATLKREVESKQRLLDVEQAWDMPRSRESLPVPNPMARTNIVYTSEQRMKIYSKLDRIRLDNVMYDGLPLSEVVRILADESKRRDPDKEGVNFILSPNADTGAAVTPVAAPAATGAYPEADYTGATGYPPATGYDTTGLPMPSTTALPPEPVDMSSISIKINPAVHNVRLQDVLDIIVKVADRPIKYSVENFGVIFSLRAQQPTPLYTRSFKVDPNTFWMGLQAVSGVIDFTQIQTSSGGSGQSSNLRQNQQQQGQGQNQTLPIFGGTTTGPGGEGRGAGGVATGIPAGGAAVHAQVRAFFSSLGVDLSSPGKSVFFNDRQGTMIVRATLQDLDIIEQAVQVLDIAPPQVNIQSKFAEVAQNDSRALGFNWYLGNTVLGSSKRLGLSGGSAPSYDGAPSYANPNGFFPGTSTDNRIPSSATDQLLTGGLRQTGPTVATLTGILTDPQFRVTLQMLEQRDGVELLSAPDVTTLSGRQAKLSVSDIRTVVTGTDSQQTGSGGFGGGLGGANSGGGVVAGQVQYNTQPLPFGPQMDVIPYVSADGFTVQMVIIPTFTEFIGYDDPGGFVPQTQSVSSQGGAGVPLTAVLPLPRFRVRQVSTTAIVWDGQTVVLGGLLSENVSKTKDKVPIIGDIPLLGRFFRSESNTSEKKNLIIFVTPTIIDPAGNRVHTDDQLPFAKTAIPQQRPVVQPEGASAQK